MLFTYNLHYIVIVKSKTPRVKIICKLWIGFKFLKFKLLKAEFVFYYSSKLVFYVSNKINRITFYNNTLLAEFRYYYF